MSLIDEFGDFACDNTIKDNSEIKNSAVIENNTNTILELSETKFDSGDTVTAFYEKLKHLVCTNLKQKGFRYGNEVLLEDEIISPTFEEVIILWCLDKVHPNLSCKIKPAFYNQLHNGQSIIDIRNDIFQYFMVDLQNDNLDEIVDGQDVAKKDPELTNSIYDPMTLIKEEDIEIHCNVFNIKGENYDNPKVNFDDDLDDFGYSEDSNEDITDNEHSDNNAQIDDILISNNESNKRSRNESIKPIKSARVFCDTCGKSLAGERKLQEHIKNKHSKTFACKECDKSFDNNDELKAHKLKDHKPALKNEMCPHCGKIIRSYGMKRHILTHISDITCKICHEKFLTQDDLDEHTKRHEEDPSYRVLKKRNIQCETCKRAFSGRFLSTKKNMNIYF